MNNRKLSKLRKVADTLTDEELKVEYYDILSDCSYSLCSEMRRKGYSKKAIREQAKYERLLKLIAKYLSVICSERKIKL